MTSADSPSRPRRPARRALPPDLLLRPVRGPADFARMAEAYNRSTRADGIPRAVTPRQVEAYYSPAVGFDLAQDLVLAEVGGALAGYLRVSWREMVDGSRTYKHWGAVIPERRRRGIGGALLEVGRARLREIAAGHPPGAERSLQCHIFEGEAGARAMVEQRGYRPLREVLRMERPLEDLPAAPLPAGLEVRPARPEHYRAVFDAHEEAFRDHWGASLRNEQDFQRWLREPVFMPTLWQVAWDGDQVAGMVLNYIPAGENSLLGVRRGFTEDICVRRPWRGRGLARALIARSLRMLGQLEMEQAVLDVDSHNESGALGLYQSLGYRAVLRSTVYAQPFDLEAP